jgi:hypothetical protein
VILAAGSNYSVDLSAGTEAIVVASIQNCPTRYGVKHIERH